MTLSNIAQSYPHEASTAFAHEFSSRWSYLSRSILNISHLLEPLERLIHHHLIPAITGRPSCSQNERLLLSLPPCLGGLGIVRPDTESSYAYAASRNITVPLAELIISQDPTHHVDDSRIKEPKAREHTI